MTTTLPSNNAPSDQDSTWHLLSISDALHVQGTSAADGLSMEQADDRLEQFGPNTFAAEKKEAGWRAFLSQYQDPMQIILLAAAVISAIIQQWATALLLLALTLFNALMGLNQEGKAEASVAALQKMMLVKSRVRRGGQVREIPAEQIVPGDIVLLEAGDRVPADGRIIRAATLEIDESALTGESAPVPKQSEPVREVDTPLGDRFDMAYMNTEVTRGAGDVLVTATGMTTEVGRISGMLQTTSLEQTPLTKQLNKLTNQIIIIAVVALALSLILGYFRGQPLETLFLTGVAFAIAAIPTGLPAVVTFLLATGTTTLAQAGAIVKRLRSVETLGSTSAINSDKTGTLTMNQMTAVELVMPGQRYTASGGGYSTNGQITHVGGKPTTNLEAYLLPMVLASDAVVHEGELVGDPTEGALVVLAAKGGIDAVATRQAYPRVAEVPFDAAYKLMATFHRMKGEGGREVIRCFVKGAPDQLLARSSFSLGAQQQKISIDAVHDEFVSNNERLGRQGLRVMAVAYRDLDLTTFETADNLLSLVSDLTMLALAGIIDPPRSEAKASIARALSAGIEVRMITGDHAITAAAIAGKLGIPGRAVTGATFASFSDEEAQRQIGDIGVIARVTPEQKVRLVEVLKKTGKIVAMTGDGVNDAPALKKADIGVAMGITGTDVAKEAAVMILTDDNFATIIRAVENGRALYDNLMKYIRFQMGSLFSLIMTFLGAGLFNVLVGIPFLPLQVLWVNFTVQLFLAIGLGLGSPTPGLMQRPPRSAQAQILPLPLAAQLVVIGLVMTAATLGIMQWVLVGMHLSEPVARTMGLTTFSLASIFFALETNDQRRSIFSRETLESRKLLQMCGWALLATFLVTTLEFLNRIFAMSNLTVGQWVICIAAGAVVIVVGEIAKIVRRRRPRQEESFPRGVQKVQ